MGIFALSSQDVRIVDVSLAERQGLESILEESFEGWYLRHSKRTLKDIEVVRTALVGEEHAGLVMLKELSKKIGYVYYIAVIPKFRKMGIAAKLLDNSIEYFANQGKEEIYACVEEDNKDSLALFDSRRFAETGFGELASKYGKLSAMKLYTKMWVVSGELVLVKSLTRKIGQPDS